MSSSIGRPKRGVGTEKKSVTMQRTAWAIVKKKSEAESRSLSESLERIVFEWANKNGLDINTA